MSRREAVCLQGGCLWLNGGVCSRACRHKREADLSLALAGPPRKGGDAWKTWYRSSWRAVRRVYAGGADGLGKE